MTHKIKVIHRPGDDKTLRMLAVNTYFQYAGPKSKSSRPVYIKLSDDGENCKVFNLSTSDVLHGAGFQAVEPLTVGTVIEITIGDER